MVDNGGDQVQGDEQEEEEAKQELKEPVTGSQEKGHPDVAPPMTEPLSSQSGTKAGTLQLSVLFLCFYGFMVQLKPGEPFITPYLLSSEKNFTMQQVSGHACVCVCVCVCVLYVCAWVGGWACLKLFVKM